jgi:hypothetical protein
MMSKSTVYRHFKQTTRWKLRHLKWDPQDMGESEKMNQVQKATDFSELLQSIKHQEWEYIVTFDEPWSYWGID